MLHCASNLTASPRSEQKSSKQRSTYLTHGCAVCVSLLGSPLSAMRTGQLAEGTVLSKTLCAHAGCFYSATSPALHTRTRLHVSNCTEEQPSYVQHALLLVCVVGETKTEDTSSVGQWWSSWNKHIDIDKVNENCNFVRQQHLKPPELHLLERYNCSTHDLLLWIGPVINFTSWISWYSRQLEPVSLHGTKAWYNHPKVLYCKL